MSRGIGTLNVLLIEDNGGDARIFEELVNETGEDFRITWARSLKEAAQLAASLTEKLSLVVTDLGLPDAQGTATIDRVMELFPDQPVIVLTGLNDSEIGLNAIQHGCQDFVVKGFTDPLLLTRTLRYAVQRHSAEKQIRESEERFRTLVQMSPDAIMIIARHSITFVNPAALVLFAGTRRQDLEGRPAEEVFHGADGSIVLEALHGVLNGSEAVMGVEVALISLSGSPLSVELSVAPVMVSDERRAQVILRDISLRRMREQEARLAQAVFDTTAEAMIVTDAHQRIVTVNTAFTQVTGYTREQAVGQTPGMLSSGRHDHVFYNSMWHTLVSEGHWRGEVWNRRADGEIYVQRVTISCIRDVDGDITNFVGVFSDITREKEASEKLRHNASHDALTGLPNRALMHDRLDQAIAKASRENMGLSVLFIDLDGFKPVNDTYGHLAGDQLLQGVASRLRSCIRESDTVARLGGDEFVILSLDATTPESGLVVAEKVLDVLRVPFELDSCTARIGASIGIALYPLNGGTSESVLEAADQAMYAAKNGGRGCCRLSHHQSPSP